MFMARPLSRLRRAREAERTRDPSRPVAGELADLRLSLELVRISVLRPQSARIVPRRKHRAGLYRHSRPRTADRLHRRQLCGPRDVPLATGVRAGGYPARRALAPEFAGSYDRA